MRTLLAIAAGVLLLTMSARIGRAQLLQYDDGDPEYSWGSTGQAVRFTVPPDAPAYRLDSISFYAGTWVYGGVVDLTVKVWEDDGNPLTPKVGFYDMGPVMHEQDMSIPYYYEWRQCDVSAANIVIASGGTFFAGWQSPTVTSDYGDASAPDGRSIHRDGQAPPVWWPCNDGMDQLIRVEVSEIPEPATLSLFGMAGIGLLARRRCTR